MITLPWKVWIDEDGKPTQRETPILVGGPGDRIPTAEAEALGLVTKDGTPREPRRGASHAAQNEAPEQEEADDGEQ